MSYLDEIKKQVEGLKANQIGTYETFMEEFIIPQFVTAVDTTAVIDRTDIIEEDINVDNFFLWLEQEGFDVHQHESGVRTISYK